MNKKVIFFFLLFFTFINVNAATISSNYKLYNKLDSEQKLSVESIPNKYTTVYNNNFGSFKYNSTITKEAPSSYDLRDYIKVIPANQGSYNTCYIFSTLTALETTLENNHNSYYDFSVMHAEYKTLKAYGGIRETYGMGGNFRMVADYLIRGVGPVLTSEVPYKEYTGEEIKTWNYSSLVGVNNVVSYPSIDKYSVTYSQTSLNSFRDMIKDHLMSQGGLSAVIYAGTQEDSTIKQSVNPNEDGTYDNVLYYQRQTENTASSNHAVTIIGWNDAYPKENFSESNRPDANGAYLVLNSWGNYDSYIWVSYEDIWIEYEINGFNYDDITDNTNYQDYNLTKGTTLESYYSGAYKNSDFLYKYYEEEQDSTDTIHTIYIGNKYTRENKPNEVISEIIIPFAVLNSSKVASATIYINPDNDSLDPEKLIDVGTIDNVTSTGYYKLVLADSIKLSGTSFAVVVQMNSVYTFINEFVDSHSFISNDNTSYQDLNDLVNENSSIYPMIIKTSILSNYYLTSVDIAHGNMLTTNSGEIMRMAVMLNDVSIANKKVNVSIYKNGVNVTTNFDILGTSIYNNEALIRIKPHNEATIGYYDVKVSYEDSNILNKGFTITENIYPMYPNLFSNTYQINNTYINYIVEKTNVNDYLNNFTLYNKYDKYVYDSNDEIYLSGNIYTGTSIKYFDSSGNLLEEFVNIVNGDSNSNGLIDIGDLVKMSNYIIRELDAQEHLNDPNYVKQQTFATDYQKMAADVNHNGQIDIGDLVKVSNYIIHSNMVINGEEATNPIKL
jgi:C1A family cysteine protease